MHFHRATAAALFLLSLRLPAAATSGRPFRFDELASVRRVGSFSLSPDGKWVAYSLGTPDVEANRTRTELWLQATSGGEPRRLTTGEKQDSDPEVLSGWQETRLPLRPRGWIADLVARHHRR